MFKYTPPWQVLCNSLEHDCKRRSSHVCSSQDVHLPEVRRILSHTYQSSVSLVPVPAKNHTISKLTMDSSPKLWVMKSLTPKLEKTDLQTMLSPDSETYSSQNSWSHYRVGGPNGYNFDDFSVGHVQSRVMKSAMNGDGGGDVVVHARQVAVWDEGSNSEDWQPSPPSSPVSTSSGDSHAGFYSFVDDPGSHQARKNEAYLVSPERLAKMSTLKEKNRFKLQTYTEERKPEKLFEEINGDSRYKVHDTAEDNDEEKPDRLEIIRSQAPKKNFKEQWSLERSKSPQSLIDGFSLCYSTVGTKNPLSEADPGAIDNQQIDFNAVRKQFLMMERSKQDAIPRSFQPQVHSPKLQERSFTKEDNISKNIKVNFIQNQFPWKGFVEEASTAMTTDEEPKDKTQIYLKDKLDVENGNQAAGTTEDFSLSIEPAITELSSSASVTSMSETPIEREIRIAQEREEDLRRSRGIFHPVTSEMVEIKTIPILSQPLPQIKPVKTKDSNRMSLLIQREMGRITWSPGVYDKGNGLGEKMKSGGSLSDQMKNTSLNTSSSITPTGRSVIVDETLEELPVFEEQRSEPEKSLSSCCPHRHQDESVIYKNNFGAERQNYSDKIPNQLPWIKAKESGRTFTSINFSPSSEAWSYKLESSNERPPMLSAPDIIRKEIEEDLRREQELQELRETSKQSLSTYRDMNTSGFTVSSLITSGGLSGQNNSSHTSLHSSHENLLEDNVFVEKSTPRAISSQSYTWNVDTTPVTRTTASGPSPRLPSVSILTAQPWGGSKPMSAGVLSKGFLIPNLSSSLVTETSSPSSKGLTEKLLEDFEERRMKMKLEESSYAGIHLIDDINNEVVEVTRVTRHKNPRALRWEAGVYANEDSS